MVYDEIQRMLVSENIVFVNGLQSLVWTDPNFFEKVTLNTNIILLRLLAPFCDAAAACESGHNLFGPHGANFLDPPLY